MKTKPATALQIRNGQLVVGGFFIGYSGLSFETPNGQQALITNPRLFHNGDLVDPRQPLDIDVGSTYQREVTLMYNLEANQFSNGTFLEEWRGPAIPNKAMVDPGLREATYRALHPEMWYAYSRGTVGRKPVLEGQQPVKDVVVIGGGGFRRGEWPLISASTREGQSFPVFARPGLSRVIGRPINNGLSSQDLADWLPPNNSIGKTFHGIPAFSSPEFQREISGTMKFRDYLGLLGEGMQGAEKAELKKLSGKMRKFALDQHITVVTPKGPLH